MKQAWSPFSTLACGVTLIFLSATHAALAAVDLPLDSKNSTLKFVGESFMHDFEGQAREFSGSAVFNNSATPPIQEAHLFIKTASLTTHHAGRDKKMDEWLDIKTHPKAVFDLTQVRLLSSSYAKASAAHPAKFAVTGTFILNDKPEPLSGEAEGWREGNTVIVSGNIDVDTLKHGLPQIRESFMTVGTKVHVQYRLVFTLPAGLP